MTAYRRGADFERRVKAKLEEDGWTVFRTAGSHSPADLIALHPLEHHRGMTIRKHPRLVQCKSGRIPMTKVARANFRDYAEQLGCEAWVALRGMTIEPA